MRSEETRGRPRYGPARHRPYAALPSLNNDARFPSSLQRTPVYSAIREKPTSKPASNRDSSRPDARTRVIVSFPKGNRLVRANHYHRFPSFFPFPFSSFRSSAVRFRFRLTQLVPSPITFRSRKVRVDPLDDESIDSIKRRRVEISLSRKAKERIRFGDFQPATIDLRPPSGFHTVRGVVRFSFFAPNPFWTLI